MALPYVTENKLEKAKNEIEKKIPTDKQIKEIAAQGGGKLYQHILTIRKEEPSTEVWIELRKTMFSSSSTPFTQEKVINYLNSLIDMTPNKSHTIYFDHSGQTIEVLLTYATYGGFSGSFWRTTLTVKEDDPERIAHLENTKICSFTKDLFNNFKLIEDEVLNLTVEL